MPTALLWRQLGSPHPLSAALPSHDCVLGNWCLKPVEVYSGRFVVAVNAHTFMAASFGLAVISSIWGPDLDIVSTVSAVASSIGNVGPGLGSVGPTENYLGIAAPGKWMLAGLMIVGRLEILPILILFNRESWRR